VHSEQGLGRLRCVSLSPRGLYRRYAGCCRTPIGNTPRDPRVSHVGLVHDCLAATAATLDATVGPARTRVDPGSALRPVG
jgi:hypothetical protein